MRDLAWFRPDGAEMTPQDWGVGYAKTLGMFVFGRGIRERDSSGQIPIDDSFFLIFNSYREPMEFRLPVKAWGQRWMVILDTARLVPADAQKLYADSEEVHVAGHATIVLRRVS